MNKHSILVVEDEALIAANIVKTLTSLGYTVHGPVVSKGKDAILAIKAQQPDLVLMDIQLIGPMNGIEAAEKIRAIVDIPIIYLTSYTDDMRLKQAQLTEPYGYIVKPANSQELHAMIKMALYKHALDRKLKESEEMFRSLIAASPDAIALTDMDGTVLMLNHQAEILGGCDQMYAKTSTNILTIFPPEEQESLAKNIQLTLEQGSIHSVEYTLIKRDDSRVPVELNTSVVMDPTGRQKRFLAIIRDITRRKWAEERLQASEEKYRTLVETLNEGIWVIDKDAITTFVNPKMARILGYTMGDMTGRSLFSFMDETGRLLTEGYIERRQLGIHEDYTFEFLKRDGTRIYASVAATSIRGKRGEYLGAIAGVMDITDRKKAEDALAESEERYQLLITNTHDIIATLNPDGVLTYVSPSWTELLGHPVKKVIGENMGEFIHPDDLASCQEFLETVIRTGQRKSGIEYRIRHSNGSWRWHTSNGVPVRNRTGKVIGYQATASDITERKKAEDALRKREHDFSSLVENNTDMIVRFDTRLRHIYCNPAVERQFGVPVRQILGKTNMEINPAHEQARFIETSLRRVLETGEAQEVEQQVPTPSGLKHFLTHIVPERDPEGSIVSLLAITRDITGRKKAEEALRESRDRFKATIASLDDAILLVDPATRLIIECNDATTRIFGYSHEELIGRQTGFLHVDQAHAEQFGREAMATYEDPGYYTREFEMRRKDGCVFPTEHFVRPIHDPDGRILYVVSLVRDITDRKRAEEALQESELLFREVFNNANDSVFLLERTPAGPGKYLLVNDKAVQMLGYSKEEFMEMSPRDIVPEDIAKKIMPDVIKNLLKDGHATFESAHRKKDGSIYPIEVSTHTFHYKGRDVDLSIIRNITERKKAEETIQHALAEKEVLLREVHHRVKNNLAGILSLIELQISSLSDPVQITPFKDLETRIRSMALVHESLSRTEDLARINVASYTQDLTRHLFRVYGTGTGVQCKIEMEDIPLHIETAIPCGLVMSEIVTNSLKFAFPKTFSCEEIRGEPCTISITLHRDGSDYLLGVADNGIGMPEGIDVTISHTLGLFLIRFIVEHQLRGVLEITAAGGTAYTIRFPEPKVKERDTNEKM